MKRPLISLRARVNPIGNRPCYDWHRQGSRPDPNHRWQLIVETADWDAFGGHWVEAGFDKFQISSSVPTDINNVVIQENRRLVQIVDILGREVTDSKNIVLFYIYDDGSVEKKVTIE